MLNEPLRTTPLRNSQNRCCQRLAKENSNSERYTGVACCAGRAWLQRCVDAASYQRCRRVKSRIDPHQGPGVEVRRPLLPTSLAIPRADIRGEQSGSAQSPGTRGRTPGRLLGCGPCSSRNSVHSDGSGGRRSSAAGFGGHTSCIPSYTSEGNTRGAPRIPSHHDYHTVHSEVHTQV